MNNPNHEIITYVIVCLIIMIITVYIYCKSEYSLAKKNQIQNFRMMLLAEFCSLGCTLIYCILVINHMDLFPWIMRIALFGIYVFSAYFMLNWNKFIVSTTMLRWQDSVWWNLLLCIPLGGLIIYMISPYFYDDFKFAEEGLLQVTTGSESITIVNGIYLLFGILLGVISARCMNTRKERNLYIKIFAFTVIISAGLFFARYFPYAPVFELSLLPASFMIYVELSSSQIYTDALTGLNNRRRVEEYLESSLMNVSEENSVEIFLFDLDYFKSINDVLGHQEGDKALQIFADALRRTPSLRGTVLGRIGGDEFIAVAYKGRQDAVYFEEHLRENLDALSEKKELGYQLQFSMGYAVTVKQGISASKLFKQADDNLYRVKQLHHDQLKEYRQKLIAVKENKRLTI